MQILITLLAFIVTIGILVTIHEWGHFIVARWCGVKVLRFSIGFGKPLWRYPAKNGTEYCIAAIPLGGYVKMLDEREGVVLEQDLPFAFNRKSVWQRIAVVLAGPVANLLFAVLAFAAVYAMGMRDFAPFITTVEPNSLAAEVGIESQDEVVAINTITTPTAQSVRRAFLEHMHAPQYDITLKRDGQTTYVTIPQNKLQHTPLEADFFNSLGLQLGVPAWIGHVENNSPAALATLKGGDRVIALNDETINSWGDLVVKLSMHPNETLLLTLDRQGERLTLPVLVGERTQQGQIVGFIGVTIDDHLLRIEKAPPLRAIVEGAQDTWFYSVLTLKSIGKMLIGQMDFKEISGPITIAVYAGNSVQIGLTYFLQFLALLSISLGVINLLPIPMLDGGHLLYYVIELIRRKPLSARMQQMGWSIGLVVLMLLMSVALYNDVTQWVSR